MTLIERVENWLDEHIEAVASIATVLVTASIGIVLAEVITHIAF